jgi:hypothetical protein
LNKAAGCVISQGEHQVRDSPSDIYAKDETELKDGEEHGEGGGYDVDPAPGIGHEEGTVESDTWEGWREGRKDGGREEALRKRYIRKPRTYKRCKNERKKHQKKAKQSSLGDGKALLFPSLAPSFPSLPLYLTTRRPSR